MRRRIDVARLQPGAPIRYDHSPRRTTPHEHPALPDLRDYDLQFFDNLGEMQSAIRARDASVGLSRLVAGHAWEWKSRRDPSAFDIEIDARPRDTRGCGSDSVLDSRPRSD